jgi:hypothetical protein
MYSAKITVIIFSSYPCSTHTTRWWWWFWFSEKIPYEVQQKEMSFRMEFDTVSRLRFIAVLFMIPPREVKMESSQDKHNWETISDWYETSDWLYTFYFYF